MFVLRVTSQDGSVSNTGYDTVDEAYRALKEGPFEGARNACVMNERADTVLRIRLLGDRSPQWLSNGSIASIKPEWRSKGEAKYLYVVKNIHEDTERCLITCINSSMSIPSAENVDIEMLIPFDVEDHS